MNAQAKPLGQAESRDKVWEMIKDIKFCQLVTHDAADHLSARPMSALQRDEDNRLWFFTGADSAKVAAIQQHPSVLLSYADPDSNTWVSINGHATVTRDRAKIDKLWTEAARGWFPKGKDDPNLALIEVQPEAAEYWDAPSSAFVIAWAYAKARVTGEQPQLGESGHVRLS